MIRNPCGPHNRMRRSAIKRKALPMMQIDAGERQRRSEGGSRKCYRDRAFFRISSRRWARSFADRSGASRCRHNVTVWRKDATNSSQLGQAPIWRRSSRQMSVGSSSSMYAEICLMMSRQWRLLRPWRCNGDCFEFGRAGFLRVMNWALCDPAVREDFHGRGRGRSIPFGRRAEPDGAVI